MLMTTYGYARVSTTDQDLSIQKRALKAAGCETMRAECALRYVPSLLTVHRHVYSTRARATYRIEYLK
jgi:hypothetical protein